MFVPESCSGWGLVVTAGEAAAGAQDVWRRQRPTPSSVCDGRVESGSKPGVTPRGCRGQKRSLAASFLSVLLEPVGRELLCSVAPRKELRELTIVFFFEL